MARARRPCLRSEHDRQQAPPGPPRSTFGGRTALVTGAAGGIGRACALRLAAAGAKVRAVDRDAAGPDALAERSAGLAGTVEPRVLDLTDLDAAEHAAAGTDFLVNNPGLQGEPKIEILEDWFPVGAGVRLADGERLNWGGPVLPNRCDDPIMALAGLAILIQESLLEWTWQVWPVRPRHHLGVHGSERDGVAVWWCAGDSGHTLAPVGELARALGHRRRRPK